MVACQLIALDWYLNLRWRMQSHLKMNMMCLCCTGCSNNPENMLSLWTPGLDSEFLDDLVRKITLVVFPNNLYASSGFGMRPSMPSKSSLPSQEQF